MAQCSANRFLSFMFTLLDGTVSILIINFFEQSTSCFLLRDLHVYYTTKTPDHHHRSECKAVEILTWISYLVIQKDNVLSKLQLYSF